MLYLFKKYFLVEKGIFGGCICVCMDFLVLMVTAGIHYVLAFCLISGTGPYKGDTFQNFFILSSMVLGRRFYKAQELARRLMHVEDMFFPHSCIFKCMQNAFATPRSQGD